ncbi:MAG: 4-hydroxybenzoate polyprenyltransferase [Asgard group archaeon]|nr:4-hydroxybenzoate polyprenyltransferase [Asgard group archaeon]
MSSKKKKLFRLNGKLTMKDPYTNTRILSKQARATIDLLRPFTLLAPLIVSMSIMVASLIYSGKTIPENWWIIVGQASFTVVLVNAASNALNQATDVKADKISKPYRPIPRGLVRAESAQSLAYILYLFALLRAVTINVWFGLFIFLIMVFTVTYSLPPRMKQYLFINQIWIAIPRGMLGILASWSVFGDPFTPTPLIIGGIATTYLIGGMATKDITDAEADKKTGIKTLINTYGNKKTALITFPFMFFPFVFIPIFINQKGIEGYLWPLTLLVLFTFIIFYLTIKQTVSSTLENIYAWSIMYVQYIIFAMGFSLLTIYSDFLPL